MTAFRRSPRLVPPPEPPPEVLEEWAADLAAEREEPEQ